ncbi:hypothetical protein SAY86_010234 [Trapa natans]|uniref:BHLH domain-containing protein n=1 Tax=Trapa natans TaxID=22666 RepID=A0AAN7KZZ6_TRANT|nr:hypothetical protein SAY86_010234 [Trapa natans]
MVAKNTNNSNKETCGSSSKDNSKASEVLKSDYIHVRARRGQATDSHSLAERVRREKISERMKFLQDLVPGCNKVTGKAGMLDEIINYVQSLQRQVEFLSMKLASVNSGLDFDIDTIFSNEMSPTCLTGFPMMIGNSSEPTNSTYLPFHPMQPLGSCSGGLDMGIMDGAISIQRPSTVPIPISEPLFDSSSFTQMQSTATAATWDSDFHNLYNMELQQARGTTATSAYQSNHQFIGSIDVTNMKMEI